MARKKQIDPKDKAKRQKVMIAVGGVLLLGLLAFQVPRTMKMLHPKTIDNSSPAPTSTAPASGSGAPLAPPDLGGGSGPAGGGTGTGGGSGTNGLADPGGTISPGAGQLVTFDRFRTKDPFSPQLKHCGGDACSAGGTKPPTKPPSSGGGTKTGGGGTVPGGSGTGGGSGSKTFKSYTSAKISIDGVVETVSVHKTFPAGDPVFELVSVRASVVKIGIAGGSYENGSQTVSLQKGKTLTLVNTADGTRYVLKLLATA
ncbi:MAG: hypothetical protein M3R70_05940 [Actinomycetota bacterium]|nr:hypothetical protein [Actinomycetota bacterium]